MTFMEEVAQAKSAAGREAVAASTTEAPTTAAAPEAPSATEPVLHMPKHGEVYDESKLGFDNGLPPGVAPLVPAAKVPETPKEAATAKTETTEEPKKAPIKIGKQEFQTIDEAVEYAKQLELDKLQNEAYIEGVKEASKKPVEPVAPKKTAYEIFAEKVFEDPVKAAADFAESLKNDIRQEYNESLSVQHQAQQAAQAKTQAWDTFYKTHPDLSSPETRDYLESYLLPKLSKEGTIKPTDTDVKFAELARKQLGIRREATLPTTELPKGPVVTVGASGEATPQVTAAKAEEVVDMVTALNRMRRRKS